MTIGTERKNAVEYTAEFLRDLCDPKKTPRIPLKLRRRAAALLRHYPNSFDLKLSQEKAPDIWGDRFEKEKY